MKQHLRITHVSTEAKIDIDTAVQFALNSEDAETNTIMIADFLGTLVQLLHDNGALSARETYQLLNRFTPHNLEITND